MTEEQSPIEENRLATQNTRFANHFIDLIGFYILSYLVGTAQNMLGFANPTLPPILVILKSLVLFLFYYTIFEHTFSKTPGKFITKTILLTEDGNRPSFQTVLIRSLCRLIPFDAFSFLFSDSGWHDKFSKTIVVYNK